MAESCEPRSIRRTSNTRRNGSSAEWAVRRTDTPWPAAPASTRALASEVRALLRTVDVRSDGGGLVPLVGLVEVGDASGLADRLGLGIALCDHPCCFFRRGARGIGQLGVKLLLHLGVRDRLDDG